MRSFLLALLGISLASHGFSGAGKLSFNTVDSHWNTGQSIRLMDRRRWGPFPVELAWEMKSSLGDPPEYGPEDNWTVYRAVDFPARILPRGADGNHHFSLLQNLDRFNFRYTRGRLSLTAGRQAIYWGVSSIVSPTDFIVPLPWGTLDSEYRTGVDALRCVWSTGALSQLEAGMVFGEKFGGNGYWTRGRFYHLRTDITATAAGFRGLTMAGGSLNRSLGGASGWVEGAWFTEDSFGDWWNLSAGCQGSLLENRLYLFGEYHHNSAGETAREDYSKNALKAPYDLGTVYLQGRHYAAAGLTFTVNPLLSLSAGVLCNCNDPSSRVDLSAEYSMFSNGVLEATLSAGTGSGGSEFRSYPLSAQLLSSFYFTVR